MGSGRLRPWTVVGGLAVALLVVFLLVEWAGIPLLVDPRSSLRTVSVAAAAVGVGPAGAQQLVVVVEDGRDGLADPQLAAAVRAVAEAPVAAVLTITELPVDIRHASKIDRAEVARWAGRLTS